MVIAMMMINSKSAGWQEGHNDHEDDDANDDDDYEIC